MYKTLKKFWLNHSLAIVTFTLFFVFLVGQSVTGFHTYNEQRTEHHRAEISYPVYLASPHFFEAVFENWESEFLQMGMYVILTVFLFQKGSAESKVPGTHLPPVGASAKSPWPVRRGGLILKMYENSLSVALFALFLASFFLHGVSGSKIACEEALAHGSQCYSALGYMTTSQFWFESFQNWQSEFLAVGSLVVLSIFLRQRGSPESKLVEESNSKTG